ncbi:MAG: 30S ribosomal protein S6 [SAR202 cluster bacterium]|jgi:ribosomal protein S6|nr:30S ribosomal protein S6 [SAR202 cluster bacterium]MQG55152.1 30S ribosomal protein S6 [SAR202 cluster bacterium]|tara:strand:+ start:94939 stop:95580 length:642 start_codon:yes stop_codon:yes gene_type:complete
MLNQEEVSQTWDKIKGFISTREAEISHEEQWGTRRLAYPIRKGQHRFLEGSYHLTRFATEKAFNIELENFLKVDDEVLRSLVTVTLPEEELAAQAAAAARAIRTPPPPRPAVDPDVTQLPAEGAAPVAAPTPASDAPVAETVTEAPTAETAAEAPAAEADPAPEASVEAEESAAAEEPETASEAEEEPTAPEGGDSPAEESEEPASEPDDSEE